MSTPKESEMVERGPDIRALLDSLVHAVRYSERNYNDGYATDEVMIARRLIVDAFDLRAPALVLGEEDRDLQLAKNVDALALALQYHPSGMWGAETIKPLRAVEATLRSIASRGKL